MKYLIIVAGALLLFFTMPYKTKTHSPALQNSDTILALGDSLTYGYGASSQQSYPAILAQRTGLHVVNAGINGETSEEILHRLPALLQRHHPALTIICAGGNDILQGISEETLKQNLKKMVEEAKISGSEVLLIAVPKITIFGLEPMKLYEDVAEETDTPLIEGLLSEILSSPSLKSDRIHPNAQGYRVMTERILKELGY